MTFQCRFGFVLNYVRISSIHVSREKKAEEKQDCFVGNDSRVEGKVQAGGAWNAALSNISFQYQGAHCPDTAVPCNSPEGTKNTESSEMWPLCRESPVLLVIGS